LNVYHWRKYNFYQRRYDVYFVDNSGIYEHHCLNFLSIRLNSDGEQFYHYQQNEKKNILIYFRSKLLSINIYMSVHTLGVVFFLFSLFKSSKEEFEDTKGVIRISI
jgi:hypothetical protein